MNVKIIDLIHDTRINRIDPINPKARAKMVGFVDKVSYWIRLSYDLRNYADLGGYYPPRIPRSA